MARRKAKGLPRAGSLLDFNVGVDRVERRGDRVFVIDGRGLLADTEVDPEEVRAFPGFVERVGAETSVERLAWQARCVVRYALLSEAGKAERLGAIRARVVELTGRAVFDVAWSSIPAPPWRPLGAGLTVQMSLPLGDGAAGPASKGRRKGRAANRPGN